MGYVARITRNNRTLINLDASGNGRYSLLDFTPPTVATQANIAEGTTSNPYGASELISERTGSATMAFTVKIACANWAEGQRAMDDLNNTLRQAGDKSDPLSISWKPDNGVPYEPIWGQCGAFRRAEILSGSIGYPSDYGSGNRRNTFILGVPVTIIYKTPIEGKRQIVAHAKGGILEDTIGLFDGSSRGLEVQPAATNLSLNPFVVLGTSWTAGANINAAACTDPQFMLWDNRPSMKLVCNGAANRFYETLTIIDDGTYSHLAYVKMSDGASPSGFVVLDDSSSLSTTYLALGNGWYELRAVSSQLSPGMFAGVNLAIGKTCYIAFHSVQENSAAIALAFPVRMGSGDSLGWSWNGTRNNSTSSCAAGYCRLPTGENTFHMGDFTVCFNSKMLADLSGAGLISAYMWYCHGAAGYWSATNQHIYFTDGTNTIQSGVINFARDEVDIFHFCATNGSLKIYQNGVQIATGNTFTPFTTTTYYFYWGSDNAPAYQWPGIIGGSIYDRAMSQAEVTSHYASLKAEMDDNQNPQPIPWQWSLAGDGVLQNHDDSAHKNYEVIGGIPGSYPAKTEYSFAPSVITKAGYYMLWSKQRQFTRPSGQNYFDISGSADGNASGGQSLSYTSSAANIAVMDVKEALGDAHWFARMTAASAAGATIQLGYAYVSALDVSVTRTIPQKAAYTWVYVGDTYNGMAQSVLPAYQTLYTGYNVTDLGVTGGTLDLYMFCQKALQLVPLATSGWANIQVVGSDYVCVSSGLLPICGVNGSGDRIMDLEPNVYNILWLVVGGDMDAHVISDTTTVNYIYVTPRWAGL